MSEFLTSKEVDEAWDRVARTSDGQIIYRHLMKMALEVSNDDGALPRREGARTLAFNLMRLMANGIVDNDRYCIAFPGPGAVAVASPATGTGARRKWLASQSWDTDRDTGDAGGTSNTGNGAG